jgi:8-hydroxy-5-deazaflavin:NADPH oxidoreductase
MKNKIGIIGSGMVGQVLATGFLKHGYEVMMGTRDIAKLSEWKSKNNGQVGSFADAAAFGEILVLATKGTVAKAALDLAGLAHLKDKIVIDVTNPIAEKAPVHGVLSFFTDYNSSLMEQLQAHVSDAHFVKAFSSVGSGLMVNPVFAGGVKPSMFIAGNDDQAKKEVTVILDAFGWETEDMGKAEAARAIEPLCILWCIPGFNSNQWSHAFRLLKK